MAGFELTPEVTALVERFDVETAQPFDPLHSEEIDRFAIIEILGESDTKCDLHMSFVSMIVLVPNICFYCFKKLRSDPDETIRRLSDHLGAGPHGRSLLSRNQVGIVVETHAEGAK